MLRLTFIYSGSSGFHMRDFCGRKNAHTEHSGPAASAFALLFFSTKDGLCVERSSRPTQLKRSAINSSFSKKKNKIVFQPDGGMHSAHRIISIKLPPKFVAIAFHQFCGFPNIIQHNFNVSNIDEKKKMIHKVVSFGGFFYCLIFLMIRVYLSVYSLNIH